MGIGVIKYVDFESEVHSGAKQSPNPVDPEKLGFLGSTKTFGFFVKMDKNSKQQAQNSSNDRNSICCSIFISIHPHRADKTHPGSRF